MRTSPHWPCWHRLSDAPSVLCVFAARRARSCVQASVPVRCRRLRTKQDCELWECAEESSSSSAATRTRSRICSWLPTPSFPSMTMGSAFSNLHLRAGSAPLRCVSFCSSSSTRHEQKLTHRSEWVEADERPKIRTRGKTPDRLGFAPHRRPWVASPGGCVTHYHSTVRASAQCRRVFTAVWRLVVLVGAAVPWGAAAAPSPSRGRPCPRPAHAQGAPQQPRLPPSQRLCLPAQRGWWRRCVVGPQRWWGCGPISSAAAAGSRPASVSPATSTAKVEKVVKPPHIPVPSSSLPRAVTLTGGLSAWRC